MYKFLFYELFDIFQFEFFRDDVIDYQIRDFDKQLLPNTLFTSAKYNELFTSTKAQLNNEQQNFIDAVHDGANKARYFITAKTIQEFKYATKLPVGRCFFLTGEGGAGKTFTLNVGLP